MPTVISPSDMRYCFLTTTCLPVDPYMLGFPNTPRQDSTFLSHEETHLQTRILGKTRLETPFSHWCLPMTCTSICNPLTLL